MQLTIFVKYFVSGIWESSKYTSLIYHSLFGIIMDDKIVSVVV